MITKISQATDDPTVSVTELRGLSTDTKPDDVNNGSVFIEMDTGKIYFFDADGATWEEF